MNHDLCGGIQLANLAKDFRLLAPLRSVFGSEQTMISAWETPA